MRALDTCVTLRVAGRAEADQATARSMIDPVTHARFAIVATPLQP